MTAGRTAWRTGDGRERSPGFRVCISQRGDVNKERLQPGTAQFPEMALAPHAFLIKARRLGLETVMRGSSKVRSVDLLNVDHEPLWSLCGHLLQPLQPPRAPRPILRLSPRGLWEGSLPLPWGRSEWGFRASFPPALKNPAWGRRQGVLGPGPRAGQAQSLHPTRTRSKTVHTVQLAAGGPGTCTLDVSKELSQGAVSRALRSVLPGRGGDWTVSIHHRARGPPTQDHLPSSEGCKVCQP